MSSKIKVSEQPPDSGWRPRVEPLILTAIIGLLSAVWMFKYIADVAQSGSSQAFDRALLMSMRSSGDLTDPLGPAWMEEIGRDITALGGVAVLTLVTMAVLGYLLFKNKRRIAAIVLLVSLGSLVSSTVLKHSIDRDRPQLVPHGSVVYTQSFPSGHSMQAASSYLTLAVLLARVQRRRSVRLYLLFLAIAVTVMVGVSRVYLGVHWPTDVLAGWTAGSIWALISWLMVRWLERCGDLGDESEIIDGD